MTADETAILRCPITRQSLRLANAEETFRVRQDIAEKAFVHPDGSPAKERFSGFLCVADTEILYPVIDNIFILLSDFAIVPQAARERFAAFLTPQATRNVMTFYDDLGWQKTGRGVFHDADINEDFRVVSRDYIHKCHLRVNDYLPRRGKYLLDVASGPIQYDDYMTYSANFERRICCDISLAALRAAAAKLGNKGIYIQGDITKLPLQDGVADGFVSLHTIYHVTAERQLAAFGELERVTRPGGCGVVVYSWGRHAWSVKLGAPARALSRLRSRARTLLRPLIPDRLVRWIKRKSALAAIEPQFVGKYAASQHSFHAYPYRWYATKLGATKLWRLRVWRSVSVPFLKLYVPDNIIGRSALVALYAFESLFPSTLGRIGDYPMFVFDKPASN